jgi:retron-type reverse transcriptase
MKERGFPVVRYADDAVILCKTQEQAEEAYKSAKEILEGELQLRMHPEKTKTIFEIVRPGLTKIQKPVFEKRLIKNRL